MSATETHAAPSAASNIPKEKLDRALLLVASVVVLGTVMSILDTTVVNVAVNTLASDFHTTLPTIQWVATGYTLALAAVIPLSGWIADRFGTKRLYMISVALFVVGSCLSGLAWNATTIILFRVLQGLGGGMIMPAGMTILTKAAGPDRLGRVMSVIGVPMLLGPILGPILGGWLVADVSWRWIFFINLPIGIAALLAAMRILPRDQAQGTQKLDIVDLLLVSPGLALVIYGLAETNSAGGFGHPKVLIPLLVGLALLAGFVWHALRAEDPLIDLRLFKDRTFATSSVSLILIAISVFGAFLLLPLYFQTVRGESALMSGVLLVPEGIGAMIAMPFAGQLSDRTGSGRIVPVGLFAVIVSFVWMTQVGAHTSFAILSLILFIFGLGLGFSMMPVFTGAMQALSGEAVARASTALNILQQTGASIGTAVLSVLLASALKDQLGGGSGTIGTGAHLSHTQLEKFGPPMASAFAHTYWWAVGMLAVAFLGSLTLPRSKPLAAEGASAPAMMV